MFREIQPAGRELISSQDGAVGRKQSAELGLSVHAMRHRVRSEDWQHLYRGVYAVSNGDLARETQVWGALLRAGPEAVLSHQTAAELYGLVKAPGSLIHMTVPITSNPVRYGNIPGVVVHRSRILDVTRHPVLTPPRTRIEDTVLDLVAAADCVEDGYDWICKAVGGRLTTAERIRQALDRRSRFPARREIELALGDVGQGALSNLELWYLRGVERRHRLPVARRQVPIKVGLRTMYLDTLYEEYQVCVELDGIVSHPDSDQWTDKRRDRRNLAVEKIVTLRFGHLDLRSQAVRCQTAADVAAVLRERGPWVGRPCRMPGCPV